MSPSGGSTLMTSAPMSASIRPQWGPESTREKSRTRTPLERALPPADRLRRRH